MSRSPFAQMLSAMDDDDGPGLTHEQQITRLSEFYAQVYAAEPEQFELGQIVWHKNPELADFKDAAAPHLFVGYEAEPVLGRDYIRDAKELHSNSVTSSFDCALLKIVNGTACAFFMDSRQFTSTAPRAK